MGIVEPGSMKLSEFLENSLNRSRGQVRESTLLEYSISMRHFIKVTGNIDFLKIGHTHGERFVQACLDDGNSAATANKKVRGIKRLFQLAIERGQLEKNPFTHVRRPKPPRRKVHVYTEDQCSKLIKAASDLTVKGCVSWELMIIVAMCTAMRRGELLNTTWQDIDFDKQTIDVSPKKNTAYTWEWHIKDTDRRTLPLTEKVVQILADYQSRQADGYPYVFIPPKRYDHIKLLHQQGKWSVRHGICPVNNFTRQFKAILKLAGIDHGEFHDLRRTCLTCWLCNGLAEYDVMNLAGHAEFETTHRFYLAIREDLLQRARRATTHAMNNSFVANLLQQPNKTSEAQNKNDASIAT
jgi:integrase